MKEINEQTSMKEIEQVYQNIFQDRSLLPEQYESLEKSEPGLTKYFKGKKWEGFQPKPGTIIEITEDDIKDGIIRNCKQCPVVNAAKRAFGNIKELIVLDRAHLILIDKKSRNFFPMFIEKKAKNWIWKFDNGEKVSPISMKIVEVENGFLNITEERSKPCLP